jgi:hypothetical protein
MCMTQFRIYTFNYFRNTEGEEMRAKERLGKIVTIRNTPGVIHHNDTWRRFTPYSEIEYISIVDDINYPGDSNHQWFKLPDGKYCNYIYPRSNSDNVRFDMISEPAPTPIPGVLDLWEVKNLQEAGGHASDPATWCGLPLKNGGITTWVDLWTLDSTTVNWLRSIKGVVNGLAVDNTALWSWASRRNITGVVLYNVVQQFSAWHCHWPIVMLSSAGDNYSPQRVAIAEYSNDGKWARLAGIPCMNDYSKLGLDFMIANGYGGLAYTAFQNGTYRLSKNGALFFVPYFSMNFQNYSKGFDGQLWCPMYYLRKKLGTAAPLPV